MAVIDEIAAERRRQIEGEGWTPGHDDAEHDSGQLARAAANYAAHAAAYQVVRSDVSLAAYQAAPPVSHVGAHFGWPWSRKWWKPKDPRRDLIRAAALIVAEIERIDRAAARQP